MFTSKWTLIADHKAEADTAGLELTNLSPPLLAEDHNGSQVRGKPDMERTAGPRLWRSQRTLIADHAAHVDAAAPENDTTHLAQTLLAEDHNGASIRGDTEPPLLLMRTKVNLRAAARR